MPELPTWIRLQQQCKLKLEVLEGDLYTTRPATLAVSLGGQTLTEMTLPNQQARQLVQSELLNRPVELIGQLRQEDDHVVGTLLVDIDQPPSTRWPIKTPASQGQPHLLGLAEFTSTKSFGQQLREQDIRDLVQNFAETILVRRNWGASQGWKRRDLPIQTQERGAPDARGRL